MPAFTEEDVERALFAHLREAPSGVRAGVRGLDAAGISVDLPGERFSPERVPGDGRWVEPRITAVDREEQGRPEEEFDRVEVRLRCFVKVLEKGGRFLELARLADLVRDLVDSTRSAAAAPIRDRDGRDVGRLQFGPCRTERFYDLTESIKGVEVPGVDVAILTTTMLATGDP